MTEKRAVIIAARRTAIGKAGGLHRRRSLEQLAGPVIKAVLADARVEPDSIDEVIFGNAAGGGGNPARLIALAAGLPDGISAITVDRQCASGLDAIAAAARMIENGAAHALIGGGAESPSTAPWRVKKPANPYLDLPEFFSRPAFAPRHHGDPDMIAAAETIAKLCHISRERQDAYALESHARAVAAAATGVLPQEIVALGSEPAERSDEGPRASLTLSLLSRMRPLASDDGTVTAGNSCEINDGAACALIVSPEFHRRLGSPPGLLFAGSASAGVDPRHLGLAAIPAAQKLLEKTGADPAEALVELNEAFAVQALATIDALSLDPKRVNLSGGALAYGHPYGASGAILVVRLFTHMIRLEGAPRNQTGLALIAAAGGVGTAALFKSL